MRLPDPAIRARKDIHTLRRMAQVPVGDDFHRSNTRAGLMAVSFMATRGTSNLDLAGLTVRWYPPQRLLKIVRREAVEAFLNAF